MAQKLWNPIRTPQTYRYLQEGQQRDQISSIFDYQCLFSNTLTPTSVLAHNISVNPNTPVNQGSYCVNSQKRELMLHHRLPKSKCSHHSRLLSLIKNGWLDRVGNAVFVTKLDLLKVSFTERASEISTFVTPDVLCSNQSCHLSYVTIQLPFSA